MEGISWTTLCARIFLGGCNSVHGFVQQPRTGQALQHCWSGWGTFWMCPEPTHAVYLGHLLAARCRGLQGTAF